MSARMARAGWTARVAAALSVLVCLAGPALAAGQKDYVPAGIRIIDDVNGMAGAGAAMSVTAGPVVYEAAGGAGQTATGKMLGAGGLKVEGGFFSFMAITPGVAIDIANNGVLATVNGSLSGMASDPVAVTSVTVTFQRKAAGADTGPYYDWAGADFISGVPVSTAAVLTAGQYAPSTAWRVGMPDSELMNFTSYFLRVEVMNTSGVTMVAESTFVFNASMLSNPAADGEGRAVLSTDSVVGCQSVTSTIAFTVGASGLSPGAKIAVRIPNGWTSPDGWADIPSHPMPLPPAGTVYVESPVPYALELNPPRADDTVLGGNWILYTPSGPLAPGQNVYFVYKGFPPPGALAGQKHVYTVLSRGALIGNLVSIATSPVMMPLAAGAPARLAFSPADPITLGRLQSSPTMQLVLTDACGTSTVTGSGFTASLSAGKELELDPSATFYASAGGQISGVTFAPGAGTGVPDFFFKTSTSGVVYEMLRATATLPSGVRTQAYKFASVRDLAVSLSGVSVDTGTLAPGLRTATMTGSGFDAPAFINFGLNAPDARWEVLVSPDPAAYSNPVFQRQGMGSSGRTVAWNWINERLYPPRAALPGEYFVRILVEGGVVVDTTTRLYIDRSASILGALGLGGAGAHVSASGPGANYGNFAEADAAGNFRVYGLENGRAYNITASTKVKTGQGQFMTLSANSLDVTASYAGTNVGAVSLPVPGFLRVSVGIPVPAPKEILGLVRARSSDLTREALGTIHFSTGLASSDDGAVSFGGTASTWTVLGLAPGTYDLDVEVSQLGLSTRVAGVVVSAGARTDSVIALQKRANVYGLAVLPTTTTFGTWVSVQATAWGARYPTVFGGSFVPGVRPGVDPTSSTFVLFGLDPGSWTVRAQAPGFVAGSSVVLVTGNTDIGTHLPGAFDLALSSAGVVRGTVTVTGNTMAVSSAEGEGSDAFTVFVDAYDPVTFSRASTRVRLPKRPTATSSTFTVAGLENGSWILTSRVQGFSEGRQVVTVAGGIGTASLRMVANDARLHATVLLPGGPHAPSEFKKVSLFLRTPESGAFLLGDMTAGTTVQYGATSAVWQSSPMAPGQYAIEAAYSGTGAHQKVEVALADKATAYATLDLRGPGYVVTGVASLAGNVQFSLGDYAVSASSIAGLLNLAPPTSYCLLGRDIPISVPAAHMELLPLDPMTGASLSGPLQPSTSATSSCSKVDLDPSLAAGTANPLRGYVSAFAADGTYIFQNVPPGTYALRNYADLDLNPGNGNEMPQIHRVFQVSGSTTLAAFKIDVGASISGMVRLPAQTLASRSMLVELLDYAGNKVQSMAVGFNNSDAAPYRFEKLPEGNYTVAVRDLDIPKVFGAMPKSVKLSGASLVDQDVRVQRTGIIKGKIALQTRLADGATGPFLLVSNNSLHLLPTGFKVEAKANPWFQGGLGEARGRMCGQWACGLELDGNDQFVAEDLLPGTYELKLWSYNSAENLRSGGMALVPMVLPSVKVEEGRLTDVGIVNVLSAVQLRGTVRSAGGTPLPNIRVVARAAKREGGRDQEAESYAVTDQNGAYTLFGIDPVVRYYDVYGAMRPWIETEGSYLPPYEQTIIKSVDVSSTTEVDFALALAPYSVSGRVTASGGPGLSVQFDMGQIVPGARVYVQKVGVIPTKNPVADIEVYTDAEGYFEAPALTAGTYRLTIASLNYGSRSMLVTVEDSSVDLGSLALSLGGSLSGSIKKPDGSSPSQDEVQMVVAANSDMSEILFGTMVKDETAKTVSDYSISGFKPGVAYTLVLVDDKENLVTPREASYLVFASSSESRGLDLVYRAPRPKVFSKARRVGDRFKVEMAVTQPLRQKKVSDDDYASILTTYSARGTLSDFELSGDRTRLSAVYTPGVAESSFTLRLVGRSIVADPDSLDLGEPEFELTSVATFYAGIDGMHQNQLGNIWGGNLLIEGDQGRVTLPSGAFGVDVSSSVQIALNISSESLSKLGVSGMKAGRMMRFAPSAYPAELMKAMEAVPPQVSPFSAFYNVMLPLGLRTSLSKPAQLTVTYSSGTDPSTLNLYWYNPAANNYILQQDVTGAAPIIDTVNRTITISVNHFSTFVLFQAGVSVITGDTFYGSDIEVFNFPNPFDLEPKTVTTIHPNSNQTVRGTMIRFSLKSGLDGDGSIKIYSVTGEQIRRLDLGYLTGGKHYYQAWDGRNDSGRDVASGVYIGVVRVGKKFNTFRMAVIR
ncbi:MAG: hypothetical protein HY924_08955 [Elusimicrobia bacterium]|nr:hypothetical protein [Elusimicrobiota bacterium]